MTAYSATLDATAPAEADPSNPTYVEMIETVISSLEEEGTAMVSHTQEGYLWKFGYGSAPEVFVQLTGLTDDDTLTVWSVVGELPAGDQAALALKLLGLNWTTTLEGRFALLNGQVVMVTSRTLAGLNPAEVSRSITIVATLADDADSLLRL
ncbi:MAG: YbjN domain-containing protein [Synechococcales cyanobacterium RM1_1_8]|nr:YbjN domain-containing protein [Synechococcales cyanobacterium RM1_1_8]